MSYNPPKNQTEIVGYHNLMSQENWSKLHPSIQKRFSSQLYESVTYKGEMTEIYLSFAGKLLAQCCRLIGNPLALWSGTNVPIEVKVYPNNNLNGMTWDRFYKYPNHSVNRVKSVKCKQANNQLVEMVGFGFGMELDVTEKNQAIVFESKGYFWSYGKLKIKIAKWLSPGHTVVTQRAISDKRFEFKLEVNHIFLGLIFKQVGEFE
ncbi:MAG: hypothetical protein COA86_12065 [Kangiella sp.]|nr:MAG: hypothetical protein COA86_12065 [Kangiella sp.]